MINFKIKEIKSGIFAIVVKNTYDRAMLFCRAQEYYESQNPKFRNKPYSIWDYIKWYSLKNNGFSYPFDWSGFNIPFEVAEKCYCVSNIENKYDEVFVSILSIIKNNIKNNNKAYIIGVEKLNNDLYKHEFCHALYHTSQDYLDSVKNIFSQIDKKDLNIFSKNLKRMGYANSVLLDETQAYLTIDYKYKLFNKGVSKTKLTKYHKIFFNNFIKFFL